jgi:hypothetical protein
MPYLCTKDIGYRHTFKTKQLNTLFPIVMKGELKIDACQIDVSISVEIVMLTALHAVFSGTLKAQRCPLTTNETQRSTIMNAIQKTKGTHLYLEESL